MELIKIAVFEESPALLVAGTNTLAYHARAFPAQSNINQLISEPIFRVELLKST